VAVAAVRGHLDEYSLRQALTDICDTLKLGPDKYCDLLDESPHEVARRLTVLAELWPPGDGE
jgi:hypothetical protein